MRKADNAVFWISANNKYGIIAHCGQRRRLGQGCTTGHQKRSPVPRKKTCCTSCQNSDCNAISYKLGTCQATVLTVNATKHTVGWVRKRPSRWSVVEANKGPSPSCNTGRGRQRSNGKTGAPRR